MKKSDFTISLILHNFFKIGTLVYFKDNSYITDENGNNVCVLSKEEENFIYKIIDGNKPFPTSGLDNVIIGQYNNIKVINIVTGQIFHCSKINITSIEHSNINGEPGIIFKGVEMQKSQVFKNPYPYL